ncbi:MAG: ATP-binding protein, partial [Anaerolineae bacterium]
AIGRDITKQVRLEEQLRQSQKMEAIGRLAGGVAHDFNNLLTTILGYSDFLLYRLGPEDPLRGDIETIRKAGERAASLTRQLLAFSRRQMLQPRVLDLNLVVAEVEKMLRRLIGEDIELVSILEPSLKRVKADLGQIEQVIMNLAVNARDAMPEGGTLAIKTENVTVDEEYCKFVPEARPGEFVRLSIEDTGVGMDKEIRQHLFEPFFTTKEGGTGLGLAVVYGIVKQHEGWINVYTEPGQGSTFKVYLPAFSLEPEGEPEKRVSLEEFRGRGEKILVVEDDEGVREFATRVLRENGYVVFEAATAEEALDVFEGEKEDFHLVFSDVVLPDKPGLQLIDELLTRKPELRVLLSSGYADRKSQWRIIRERGFRFLQKPYASADLLRVIREIIEPS